MSDADIKDMISNLIKAQVIQALNETPDAVGKLIEAAINKPVDPSTGRADGYSSGRIPYIDYLVGAELRDAARQIVRDVFAEQGKEHLTALIRAKLSGEEIANAFAESVVGAASREWDISVQFERHKG